MARSELTSSPYALALSIPPVLVTMCSMALLVMAMFGVHPFWRETPVSMTEAIVAGDHARVLQMIQHGEDPNRGDADGTPLEHAVRHGDLGLVDLLLNHGVVLDEGARRDIACAAFGQGAMEIHALLRAGRSWTCSMRR